ncbi:glycosyltransferase family A protein [Nonomuraea maheshkhaliensis]|uniref:glycosyltransferase family A protein n=1 Tax=Nonomuraea maheshkhaliensis TaxID=419590 RepID=UPI0031F97290
MSTELESTRRALREAVSQAGRAAELARLLDAAQARLAAAEQNAEEAKALAEQLSEAEERLAAEQAAADKLRKELAEQRFQAEVANWKLSSIKVARWNRLGDAIKSGKSNPVRLARGLKGAAKPVKRPSAPKRRPVAAVKPKDERPGAAFQATSTTRTLGGASFKLKPFRVPTGPNTRPHLTAAVIADPHAEALLRYEWRQTTGFTPRDFARVLPLEVPHLLVVESVTQGPWAEEITGEPGEGLKALLAWCAERGIRTVFWHTGGDVAAYAAAADLFEHRFTTDLTVAWPRLQFGVQPRVHNPLPLAGGRIDRVLTLDQLLPGHLAYPDVLTSYRWPAAADCPPGTPQWRLAEIAACGTPIGTEDDSRRAHVALRRAYSMGTMSERIDELLDAIGLPSARPTLNTSVLLPILDPYLMEHALAQVARQSGVDQLIVIGPPEAELRARDVLPDVEVIYRRPQPAMTEGAMLNAGIDLCEADLVAVMDPRDVYGPHYLSDLRRAFLFTTADIVGKAAFYAHLRKPQATLLKQPDAEYSYLPEITGGTLLARRNALRELGFADLTEGWDEVLMRQCRTDGIKVFSADRFGYVRVRDEDRWLLGAAHLVEYGSAEPHALI